MPNIPVAPSFSSITANTFTVDVNSDGNPGTTFYSFRVVYGVTTKYVDGTGTLQDSQVYLNLTTISVSGAIPNTIHAVSLMAADDALGTNATSFGPSASLTTLSTSPLFQPFKSISSTAITADWSPNSNPAGTQYYVELSTDVGFNTGVLNSGWITTEEYQFTNLIRSTTYYGRVKSRNSSLVETLYVTLGSVVSSDGPDTVKGIHVFNMIAERGFLIKWSYGLENNISSYNIYRSPSPTDVGEFKLLASVPGSVNTYLDRVPFTFGIVFYYVVTSVDDGGNEGSLRLTTPINDNSFHSFEEQPFVTSTLVTVSDFVNDETPGGLVDGINMAFNTLFAYKPTSLEVYLNGVKQTRTVDYTEGANTLFTMLAAPQTGDIIRVNYIKV